MQQMRTLAGAAALATALLAGVDAQQPATPQPHPHEPAAQGQPASDMMAKCHAAMAEHQKMMAEMQAADARLDALVAKMNAATGQQKADAAAAVVAEMVSGRKAMRENMMQMQHSMMQHMMDHSQAGDHSMAACPMMKGHAPAKP